MIPDENLCEPLYCQKVWRFWQFPISFMLCQNLTVNYLGRDETPDLGNECWWETASEQVQQILLMAISPSKHPCLPLAEPWLGQESTLPLLLISHQTLPPHSFVTQVRVVPTPRWIVDGLSLSSCLWLVLQWALDQVPPSIVMGYLFRNFWERSPCS